jgi:hypothetical protein
MKQTFKLTTAASIVALGTTFAGDVVNPHTAPTSNPNNGDWCSGFKNVGKLYKNDDAPYIQSLKFFGRLQWQAARISGDDVNNDSFSDTLDEYRRVRFGAEVVFLNNFKLKGNINLIEDGVRSGMGRNWGYKNWDVLTLSYKLTDIAGFDTLGFSYGRHKIAMGHESHMSSKEIKTVERSAISNKIYDNRYTGIKILAERGNWAGILGFLSLDSNEALGGWSEHGDALYLSNRYKICDDKNLLVDFFYNLDADSSDDEVGVGYEWVASIAYETSISNWNLMVNLIYGDNGDEDYAGPNRDGNFYGLVIMPSTFLVEDKLEFVARYLYQGSDEEEGIRSNSRYFRAGVLDHDVNSGRGDSHHSIYTGLNWYLCGQNSKIMIGAEYETLDTPKGDADATTLWTAYRMYF